MIQIPKDDKLNTEALGKILNDTQNSYKHLLFGYIFHELPKRASNNLVFTPAEMQTGMLKIAEFPAIKCHLSLGLDDQTKHILSGTQVTSIIEDALLKYVPYRLLRPFFREELKNKPDQIINQSILQLAEQGFSGPSPPLYRLRTENSKLISIEIHKSWQHYLVSHFEIIDGWRQWHWATYLQRRNPSALNVMQKLVRPNRQTHELNKIRTIWREMSKSHSAIIRCTYSNSLIESEEIVVDHYLPWSYLGHDQSWNLCPTVQSINSKKSDQFPSEAYLKSLALIQHRTLHWMKQTQSKKKWGLFSEEYLSALQISEEQLLDRSELELALERASTPHYLLAKNMGFKAGWLAV
jgi:hypothetical protein